MTTRPDELIEALQLAPHPEGGHYREVHRSEQRVRRGDLDRSALTTIYFLLRHEEVSRWHVVTSDEAWHFYEGDPLELLSIEPATGRLTRTVLGVTATDAAAVHVVPADHWQAARSLGAFTLVGCTVGPGFEFDDFRFVADVPGHEETFEGVLAPYRSLL
jgi:predicted cupin superfamily sugar epimerase